MYDDDDLDSVLFGGDYGPDNDAFDPFSTVSGESNGEGDNSSDGFDSDAESNNTDGVIRYGRFSTEAAEGFEQDDDRPVSRAGISRAETRRIEYLRQQQAEDTGNRNVRRVAAERSGSVGTGVVRRERSEGVANSILDAQQRIRAESSIPLSDGERESAVRSIEVNDRVPPIKPKRHYEKQGVSEPPQFKRTAFEAMIIKLQANATGDWIVTLKVPANERENATILGDAYGLALDVVIERLSFKNGNG